tara:strand:- start:393 stop:521 length:129 start_codon:yes stop_codon:yes gene_type:complete
VAAKTILPSIQMVMPFALVVTIANLLQLKPNQRANFIIHEAQ